MLLPGHSSDPTSWWFRRAEGPIGAARSLLAVCLLAVCLLAAGCGSSALTHPRSPNSAPRDRPSTTLSGSSAVGAALIKLSLISQDGCQTQPAERIYRSCDRFLAELRSAVGTVRSGSATLPDGRLVAATSTDILAGADTFDRDGCGSGPYASGPATAGACTRALESVRSGLTSLLGQTRNATPR